MKKTLLTFLSCLLLSVLTAQTYDISQYTARYERRPLLEIDPSFKYSGELIQRFDNEFSNSISGSVDVLWQERLNLEHKIQSFSLSSSVGLRRSAVGGDFKQTNRRNNLSFLGNYERYNYVTPKRFWGVNGNIFVSSYSNLNRNELELVNNGQTDAGLRPGFFFGSGRIDYAEDALLANWMMDDLVAAGTINSAAPEQRKRLAQRITSIIGNRTFDFRRRRIYELQQLQLLFQEEGIVTEDDFSLFAILNDNWVFANRVVLPHGKRWKLGVDGRADLAFSYFTSSQSERFSTYVSPYIENTIATIRKNRSAHIWDNTFRFFYQSHSVNAPNSNFTEDYRYGAQLSLSHTYLWLPNSRTTLSLRTTVNGEFRDVKFSDIEVLERQNELRLDNRLVLNYFINNQWTLQVLGGVNANFFYRQQPTGQLFGSYLELSSRYYLF